MSPHYVYSDAPDIASLKQGDVLQRTDELVELLRTVHPHYGQHEQYRYFMVLTQTCDLVRRSGRPPKSRYITLAAVRPVEELLRRVATEQQDEWQRIARVLSTTGRDKVKLFLERLLDTNEPGYFYLHPDSSRMLTERLCAFLQLSVALRRDHYDLCLRAKVFELDESFQAKLGWLIGDMSSRVAVTEWDEAYGTGSRDKEIADLLKSNFVTYDDRKIREALDELGDVTGRAPAEIAEAVKRKKLTSRKQKLQERALAVLAGSDIVEQFRERLSSAVKQDQALVDEIEKVLAERGLSDPGQFARDLIAIVRTSLRRSVTEASFPGRDKLLRGIVGGIVSDALVEKILND